jgi:hypothetical protein
LETELIAVTLEITFAQGVEFGAGVLDPREQFRHVSLVGLDRRATSTFFNGQPL